MEIEIIYSDPDLVVINKPPGISVHAGETVQGPTVADFLLEKFPEIRSVGDEPLLRPGIVHRLDKNTSGIMVAARTQESFLALKELFKNRLVEKTYWAVCCGKFKEKIGRVEYPIGRLISNPLKRGAEVGEGRIRGAREALTEYKVLKDGDEFSLVELKPKTGRMHQLRVHMAAIHHPVACDPVYGGKKVCCPASAKPACRTGRASAGKPTRQLLHARSLSFSFPEGRKLRFEADEPEDFSNAVKILESQANKIF